MRGLRVIMVFGAIGLLSACAAQTPARSTDVAGGAYTQVETGAAAKRDTRDGVTITDEAGTALLQTAPYRVGVSSATVERLARKSGCEPRTGASLLTEKGPVEVYRVQCDDGSRYLAQCELRQCQPMRR